MITETKMAGQAPVCRLPGLRAEQLNRTERSTRHMTRQWRTLYLTHRTVMTDGRNWSVMDGAPTDLPDLLARVAQVAPEPGMTVVLDCGVHTDLGLPERLPNRGAEKHPALEKARAVGWRSARIDPWMTFWRPNSPSIYVGVRPWLNGGNFALADTDPKMEQRRLYQFHQLIGVPYHGATAGLAGITLLRDHQRGKAPMWAPKWDRIEPAHETVEVVTEGWRTELPAHGLPFEHSFDARMQFLAAAMNAKLAVNELRGAPVQELVASPTTVLPGYYRVTVPPWALADRIPHPLGHRAVPGEQTWITGATLELAYELSENEQVMAAPEVHAAWVSPGGPLLRSWATKIRDAEVSAREIGDPVLHATVKDVYKVALGLLRREGGRVHRPDWQQTIVSVARSNLWRKIWREGRFTGRWPVEIHADAVWYASPSATPFWPSTFRQGHGLGCFAHEDTREVTA